MNALIIGNDNATKAIELKKFFQMNRVFCVYVYGDERIQEEDFKRNNIKTKNFWDVIELKSYLQCNEKYLEQALDDTVINRMLPYALEVMIQYGRMGNAIKRYGTFTSRKNLFLFQLQYWYNFLTINQIDLVVFGSIPHEGYDYLLYWLCKEYGIKTVVTDVVGGVGY